MLYVLRQIRTTKQICKKKLTIFIAGAFSKTLKISTTSPDERIQRKLLQFARINTSCGGCTGVRVKSRIIYAKIYFL